MAVGTVLVVAAGPHKQWAVAGLGAGRAVAMEAVIEGQCDGLCEGIHRCCWNWVGQEAGSQNRENCRDDQTESKAEDVTYSERPAGQTVFLTHWSGSLAGMAHAMQLRLGSTPLYLQGD